MVNVVSRDGRDRQLFPNPSQVVERITERNAAARRSYNQVLAETLQAQAEQALQTQNLGGTVADLNRGMIMETLSWEAPHPQAGCHVFRTLEEMAQVWLLHGGEAIALPQVNFEQFTVLAVFSGEGSFREYTTINRLKYQADMLEAYICSYTRPWTVKNPMSVIQIAKTEQPIRFITLM